jgi:hypothetical protein
MNEREHFRSVLQAFRDHQPYMMLEVDRRERHASLLSQDHLARLPQNSMAEKIAKLKVGKERTHI